MKLSTKRVTQGVCAVATVAVVCASAALYIRKSNAPKKPPAALHDIDIRSYGLSASVYPTKQAIHATVRIEGTLVIPSAIVLDSAVAKIVGVTDTKSGAKRKFSVDEKMEELRIETLPNAKSGDSFSLDIAYEAEGSAALTFYGGTSEDPVAARLAYTGNAPTRVPSWMPCHNTPADRAKFVSEFELADGENAVASGQRESDANGKRPDGRNVVKYSSVQEIPIDAMGFAAGALEVVTAKAGHLPVQMWHRPGAVVDTAAVASLFEKLLPRFENQYGSYPFPSLNIAFLPDLPNGAESASLLMVDEASGQGILDRSLFAHEFAHQWIGVYATIASWGDLWIKEGLAVMSSGEALAIFDENPGSTGSPLYASNLTFDSNDAIVNPMLSTERKPITAFTTGPYNRAAWLFSQVRAQAGDTAFFAAWKDLLAASAWGTIATTEAIDTLVKLGGKNLAPILPSMITSVGAPRLNAEATAGRLKYSLENPGNLLIAPVTVTVVNAAGVATVTPLKTDAEHEIDVEIGGYAVFDEADVHTKPVVPTEALAAAATTFKGVSPLALNTFLSRSVSAEFVTIAHMRPENLTPQLFGDLFPRLRTSRARAVLLAKGCEAMKANPGEGEWAGKLEPALRDTKNIGYQNMAACGIPLAERVFGAEADALVAKNATVSADRLEYILGFDFGEAASLRRFGPLAESSPSSRIRNLALRRLRRQVEGKHFSPVPENAKAEEAWANFFLRVLANATSPRRLLDATSGSSTLGDARAVNAVAERIRSQWLPDDTQSELICLVPPMATTEEFFDFAEHLPSDQLGETARERASNPDSCSN
jgi:aminopeptidase N